MGMCWDDRISWELDGIGIDISNNMIRACDWKKDCTSPHYSLYEFGNDVKKRWILLFQSVEHLQPGAQEVSNGAEECDLARQMPFDAQKLRQGLFGTCW